MTKKTLKGVIGLLVVTALAATACSREKEANKTALPPGHDETARTYLKNIEESKKVVVARVNGEAIRMNTLIDSINQIAPKYVSSPKEITPEIDQKVRKEAIDILIFRELALQEAVKRGMKVQPERVSDTLNQLRANAGSEEVFKKRLEMEGKTEDSLRKEIERNVLFDMIAEKEILSRVRVDEKRLREVYEKNRNKYRSPESFDIEDVVIMKDSDDTAMMKKAKYLLSQIKKVNNDFSKLPQDGTFLFRRGTIIREEYPHLFEASARLKPGDLSDVIREDDGLHLIKVTGRQPASQLSFEEARPLIESELKSPLIEKRKQDWEEQLRKNAKIEIIPLEDSQKPTLVH